MLARNASLLDDNDTNRMIIREHLARLGAQTIEAPDGLSTLTALHKAQERGEPFRLAILDYHLPDINGMILAQAIRQQSDCARLPLIMQTSQMRNDHTLLMRTLDVNRYLYKPITRTNRPYSLRGEHLNERSTSGKPNCCLSETNTIRQVL
jgi:CheY-like chemotaxis protein